MVDIRWYYRSTDPKKIRKQIGAHGNPYRMPNQHVEYQIFSQDYFSSADMHIYFGDIWIDEITDISFTLTETVMPIYGYHSYTYDYMARGRRIVEGSFAINFKSSAYLYTVLENAAAISYMVNDMKQRNMISPADFSKYKLDEILKMYGKESFDQLADEFEKALWGVQEDKRNMLSQDNQPYFRLDPVRGFDIKINYGAVSEVMSPNQQAYYKINNIPEPNVTVEIINGVQIYSVYKRGSIQESGRPITEVYQFYARDINAPLKR